MPRKKKRIPLSREEALRAEDEFMLNYGHLSLWYDGWYNSRGKAIIDAREKALAEWEAQLPTVRFASKEVQGPVLGGGHEPGARFFGDAGLGPLLQRGHQRLLSEVLRHAHIPDHASEGPDESGRLDAPERFDRAWLD